MTTALPSTGLIKITGHIADYRCKRSRANFIFSDGDQTAFGVVAVAAGIAGLSGQAISTAANASSMEEEADYVEFQLAGKVAKGWVWHSPFKNGEAVEVAAEWQVDHYEIAGILRPADRVLALYPHCSRGRTTHVKNSVKWWLLGTTLFMLGLALLILLSRGFEKFLPYFARQGRGNLVWLIPYAFFGLMTFSMTRKWMPFVRLAEKVFTTLGLPNPSNIDLIKSSKAQRKPTDPGEYGIFYFRY